MFAWTRPHALGLAGPRAVDRQSYLATIHAAVADRLSPPLVPTRAIGGYRIDRKIGEGGGSVVYAAYGVDDGRIVAIKIPKGEAEGANARIKSDFRAARRLQHRNVVRMHHLLPAADRYAAVMEWLGGPSLIESVRRSLPAGRLPSLARLLPMTANLAAALAHIHAAGWVHGDIKPDNVHCTERGTPRWLDFDLATPVQRPLWMPPPEHLVGTFAYLPPEAITGQPAAPPADMFSFGRMLSRLVGGRLPSWDPSMGSAVSAARIRQQLPRETPRELLNLCTQLVHTSPAERLTAAEVYHAITGKHLKLNEPRQSPPPPVQAAACQVMARADGGQGTLLLVETDHSDAFEIEHLLAAARSDEPRLILCGHCDRDDEATLRGFDAIFDQLAIWVEQVPGDLRADWRQAAGPELAAISPRLATALGLPPLSPPLEQQPDSPPLASDPACDSLVRLLVAIAQERTVVLAIQNLHHLDEPGERLFTRLARHMPTVPIVLAATIDRRGKRTSFHPLLPPAATERRQITFRVGC